MSEAVTKTLLSISDFTASTGLGRTKAYELIGSGELETITIGRRRMIPVKSLENWIESQLRKADV